jgi:hypothetical protein
MDLAAAAADASGTRMSLLAGLMEQLAERTRGKRT